MYSCGLVQYVFLLLLILANSYVWDWSSSSRFYWMQSAAFEPGSLRPLLHEPLIREGQETFSQSWGEACIGISPIAWKMKPTDQPTDTAVCTQGHKEGNLSQTSTCVNCQVQRLHATGQIPRKCWRSWPCQDRGLGAGRSSDGGSIPSCLMPQSMPEASLWPEKMALVLWEVCHLAGTVPPSGWGVGDSE